MNVENLVSDIYKVLEKPVVESPEDTERFAVRLSQVLVERLASAPQGYSLRLSNWARCVRQHHLMQKFPEEVTKVSPRLRLMFIIGDIFEEVLLYLAKKANHDVQGEQKEVSLCGVKGHIDAIIDGRIVDIKSASPFSFGKFSTGGLRDQDSFGYLGQIGAYVSASSSDPLVTDKGKGSFLAGNKVTGALVLDTHEVNKEDILRELTKVKDTLDSGREPERAYEDIPFGKSGNRSLGVACSYCPVKHLCWKDLRAFQYSDGVKFLTVVKREPKTLEVPV